MVTESRDVQYGEYPLLIPDGLKDPGKDREGERDRAWKRRSGLTRTIILLLNLNIPRGLKSVLHYSTRYNIYQKPQK